LFSHTETKWGRGAGEKLGGGVWGGARTLGGPPGLGRGTRGSVTENDLEEKNKNLQEGEKSKREGETTHF